MSDMFSTFWGVEGHNLINIFIEVKQAHKNLLESKCMDKSIGQYCNVKLCTVCKLGDFINAFYLVFYF